MIEVHKIWENGEGSDPFLVYDEERGEMWGYPEIWEWHSDKVGMSEDEFKSYFDGPHFVAGETDEDPFEEVPNAEELLRNYPPGSENSPEGVEDSADQAAEKIAERATESLEGGTGNLSKGLSSEEYKTADDVLKQMHERLAEWDGNDLSKAPPVWDSDDSVPEYVKRLIEAVVDGDIVWDKFEGYSRRAAERIQDSLEENLSQPQGWSLRSLVEDLEEMYPGMDEDKAMNIARTETSAIINSAREEAYEEQEGAEDFVYYWQGPDDTRTTPVCMEIKEEVNARGGNVPMEELREILREKARKYHNTRGGGTPERVDEWTPHYQCRHTFVRDVKADL